MIVYSDGSFETRPAGTYSFHTTHAHFHDDGILTYELFRVDGATLTPAGMGTKSGSCPADQLMGEWRLFGQEPAGLFGVGDTPTGSCYGTADSGMLALTGGWGDVYRRQRPGQYVEFSGNGDGHYVARATVDKGNTTLETDETDNASYALIRVSGRRVELVERGQGASHLDPDKAVFTGHGRRRRTPTRRCGFPPRDTGPAMSGERTGERPPLEAFRRGYLAANEAFNRHDFEAAFSGFHPDVEWQTVVDVPGPRVMRGRQAVILAFEALLEEFRDWRVEPQEFIDAGHAIVVRNIATATGQESGVPVRQPFTQVVTFSEGRPIRVREYLDHAEAVEALGLGG